MLDLAIVGGGPAGLTAGIYAARARLNAALFERFFCGGQVLNTSKIENYPGFPEGIEGPKLIADMENQAKGFGLHIVQDEIVKIIKEADHFALETGKGKVLAKSVIICTGTEPKKLDVPGEKEFVGKGVSYCATCDGPFFKDRVVTVVGGGDSALEEALYLSRFAKKIYLVHRRHAFRATPILQERVKNEEKIEPVLGYVVESIIGDGEVKGVLLKEREGGKKLELSCDGVFIYVGLSPNTSFVKGFLELDETGFIISDENMATSVDGIFCAGDVRKKVLRQVSTAVGDGATAAFCAQKYLEEKD